MNRIHFLLFSSCAIADPKTDSVIVIGGLDQDLDEDNVLNPANFSTFVTRYNAMGFVESLPPLKVGRAFGFGFFSGCSGFYNEDGNLVILIPFE